MRGGAVSCSASEVEKRRKKTTSSRIRREMSRSTTALRRAAAAAALLILELWAQHLEVGGSVARAAMAGRPVAAREQLRRPSPPSWSVRAHRAPLPISPLVPLVLRGGGALVEDIGDIGQLGLDALGDDDVLLAGDEASADAQGLLDLTGDGGVLKALMVHGWKSPLLGTGDEISVAVVGREARPNGLVFLNRTEADPLVFRYGKTDVVPGLQVGVASMKLGEKAIFVVRSDYGYGAEEVWKGLPPHATIEFEVEVLSWGNKDLSDGKGAVLFKVLDSGCGWDQPSPQDEALVSVQARRSTDGKIVVDSGGPQWVSLGAGLLPRGLALAITQMSQDMKAQAVIAYSYMFSDVQLQAAADEVVKEHEDLLEPSPFFHPNFSHWLSSRSFFPNNTLHTLGIPNLHVGGGRKATYIYTIHLHSFNRILEAAPSSVRVKVLDVGAQEYYQSEIEDGAWVEGIAQGWVVKDGFRASDETFIERSRFDLYVGSGQARGLSEARVDS